MKYIAEEIIWGYPLIIVLLGASIYFGLKTKFVQFRYLKLMPQLMFEKNSDETKISPFQTIALILGNHVGTGNILGVSAAIMYGGPGAIFWMWITALLGSVLSFVENTLGQLYKIEINKEYRGGAAYYILYGLGSKMWAQIIAFTFFICLGLFMPTIQAAAISTTFYNTFNFPKVYTGIFLVLAIGVIIVGNSKRIVQAAEVIVPFMALFYLLIALIIIIVNISKLDDVIVLIINSALNKNAFYGGLMGSAFSYGIRRGLFTHEAGIGSGPNLSASSNVSHPVKQGLLSSFCVFIDTLIICSASVFMILLTDSYIDIEGDYSQFVAQAINTVFINLGPLFVALSIFLFGFTSLFSGFYNAQSNLLFICNTKSKYQKLNILYKVSFLVIIFLSSIFNVEIVWSITDIGVGVAAFVNIIVITLLANKVLDVLNDFELKYKKKEKIKYYNKNLPCWGKED